MLSSIPIFGWMLSAMISMSLSVPFYFIWNRIAPVYFYWLPKVYLDIPFWDCVGIFMVVPIVKWLLTPSFVSVSQTNGKSS